MSTHRYSSVAELQVAFMQFVPVELRSEFFRFAQIHFIDKCNQIVERGAGGIADFINFLPEDILMCIDERGGLASISQNDRLSLFNFFQQICDGIVVEMGLQSV